MRQPVGGKSVGCRRGLRGPDPVVFQVVVYLRGRLCIKDWGQMQNVRTFKEKNRLRRGEYEGRKEVKRDPGIV